MVQHNLDEHRLERLRQRAVIRPEIAAKPDILAGASALNDILHGQEDIIRQVNKWTISRTGQGGAVLMLYDDMSAAFGFYMREKKDEIVLENDHRFAKGKGLGIVLFSELEHMAAALATINKKPVTFIFPLFQQEDTELFLLQRDYNRINYSTVEGIPKAPAMKRIFKPIV